MEREYEVVADDTKFTPPGSREVYETGETFKTDAPLAHEGALIEGGTLALAGPKSKQAKLECPACKEQGVAKNKVPKFDVHEDLLEHYEQEHAGLVPPTAGEEA